MVDNGLTSGELDIDLSKQTSTASPKTSHERSPMNPKLHKVETGISIDRTNGTARIIEKSIHDQGGRIPFSKFMEISLFGPEGYYSKAKAKIGIVEDFVTMPERSEYFGATIGRYAKKVWEAMERPDNFPIIEMGAGNGTLAKDMLAWAREEEPDFYNALRYGILEYGDLIKEQKKTINGVKVAHGRNRMSSPRDNMRDMEKVCWIQGSASELPLGDVEGIFLSNELPDAFPVEIVRTIARQVKQKFVTLENDQWVETWEEPSDDVRSYIEEFGIVVGEDTEEPININAERWQRKVDNALKKGAIITIDYGQNGNRGLTKNVVRTYPMKNEAYSEYRSPGDFDITSNVNFQVLADIAQQDGLHIGFQGGQAEFLLDNGIGKLVAPELEKFRTERSIKKLVALDRTLNHHRELVQKRSFMAQVLHKGIKVDTKEEETEEARSIFKTGFRLNVGRPHTGFIIEDEPTGEHTVVSDKNGYISFDKTDVPLSNLFAWFGITKIKVQTSDEVVLDTSNKEELKRIVEKSGYIYDLVN